MLAHLSSSDDDLEEVLDIMLVPKCIRYFEETVPQLDEEQYMRHFRISRELTEHLADHVFIGFPGSVHDSRAFRASPLSTSLAEKCNDFHILGDSGYPCLQHLLTPFRDNGHLTRQQATVHKIENIVHLIRACCVLHNLALHEEFPMEEDDLPAVINVNENVRVENDDQRGAAKRMDIMNNMPQLY
nr:unnamed protein product [Callosobruchus analis]CAI5854928.1 unnamed protein product [Callosobruchus analis]